MSMNDMNLGQLGSGNWLKYDDVTQDTDATIAEFDAVEVNDKDGGGKKIVNVIRFKEFSGKQMELKASIRGGLALAFGERAKLGDMVGKKVCVYRTTDRFGGKTYNVLRLRPVGGGSGPDFGGGPATLGPGGEAKLTARIAEINAPEATLGNLRVFLAMKHPKHEAVLQSEPRNWPAETLASIKAWIDEEDAKKIPF